jgi:5'-deoxynucleotidase YfbR-like HD superfamily hydrolase
MSIASRSTFSNGCGIDLQTPTAADIDFESIAEHLAKEPRFNGATRGKFYSVAEHCCRGADALLEETGNSTAAAYFLLHDAHEALLRDDTTPKKRAIAEIAAQMFGVLHEEILEAFAMLEMRLDQAIHAAAGLRFPIADVGTRRAVRAMDERMFVSEWRDLMKWQEGMKGAPMQVAGEQFVFHPEWDRYAQVQGVRTRIDQPWDWPTAKLAWLRRANALLPAMLLTQVNGART